jgi:hypothetical protein
MCELVQMSLILMGMGKGRKSIFGKENNVYKSLQHIWRLNEPMWWGIGLGSVDIMKYVVG